MINRLKKIYFKLSLTTQTISTIILVFISFFILQLILNTIFFGNYFTNREIERFEEDYYVYLEELRALEPQNRFNTIHSFTNLNNASSLILSANFQILESNPNLYTIEITDFSTNESYEVMVEQHHEYILISAFVMADIVPYDDNLYAFENLLIDEEGVVFGQCSTDSSCLSIEGRITKISRPNHLNYIFEQYPMIQRESNKINRSFLQANRYGEGHRYQSTDGINDVLVYIDDLSDDWKYVMTIVPIQDTSNIIGIVSSYQNYVYATAVIVILLWSFRIGTIVSSPIKNIEKVARQIADLNFDVKALEHKNFEASSLSNSINLMATNLKSTIETINKKNDELLTLYEDQSKQVNLKKQLVSTISHELKTPLMIMQVTVQGIIDGVIPKDDVHNELDNLLEEINKSSIMIQDLLQIYRLDSKDTHLDNDAVNVSDIVHYYIRDFGTILKKYNFSLVTDIDTTSLISADEKLITRVISNFMTNAIKYTPENETIHISVRQIEDRVHVEFINSGIEIPVEDLQNIWIPFYRINQESDTRLASKGTGIGLYLVSEILKAHNYEFGIKNTQEGVKAFFIAPIYEN